MTDTEAPPRWLEYRPAEDLPEHPRNPSDHDLPELLASMRRFGFTTPPMLCERSGLLAEGHGRKKATLLLKAEGGDPPPGVKVEGETWLVPVVRGWSSADDAELEAYLLAGNYRGGWQNDKLAELLSDLAGRDGLTGTGFKEVDVDLLISELAGQTGIDQAAEWQGMDDYENVNMRDHPRLVVHFLDEDKRRQFLELIGNPTVVQNTAWWPHSDGHKGEDWSVEYVTAEDRDV